MLKKFSIDVVYIIKIWPPKPPHNSYKIFELFIQIFLSKFV